MKGNMSVYIQFSVNKTNVYYIDLYSNFWISALRAISTKIGCRYITVHENVID